MTSSRSPHTQQHSNSEGRGEYHEADCKSLRWRWSCRPPASLRHRTSINSWSRATPPRRPRSKGEISADTAEKITQACVAFAKEKNIAVTVFILNPTGQIVHAHRMDGQVPINVETALLKAKSVLYTRDSTHARANMVANNLALQLRWSRHWRVSHFRRTSDRGRRSDDRLHRRRVDRTRMKNALTPR